MTAETDVLRLPRRASIVGSRSCDKWEVIATYDRHVGGGLRVDYFVTEPMRAHRDDWSFINEVLPKMHDRFVRQLAELFANEHKR